MTDNIPIKFEDAIKAKLKGVVADMIPEDRWDNLVKMTVHDFEKNDLPKIIKDELAIKYKQLIQEQLSKPEFRANYNNGSTGASDMVKQFIIESAPLILAQLIGGSVQLTVAQLQSNMQNYRGY